jgi:FkbM family methyltransferase
MTGKGRHSVGRIRRGLARLRPTRPRPTAGSRLLHAFERANPSAFFIEIGANDGEHHDHLRSHILRRGWSGILVEPVPHIFQKLVHTYTGFDGIALENLAIAGHDGELPFHYLAEPDTTDRTCLPDWYDGVGSLSLDTVLTHAQDIPDLERRLVTTTVPILTFESLCARHSVTELDLLSIDTEGYDWEILRTIDFSRWRPQLVIYEHFHLSPADRAECANWMRTHGYRTMEESLDTFCLADNADRRVETVWERLVPTFPGVSKSDELSKHSHMNTALDTHASDTRA